MSTSAMVLPTVVAHWSSVMLPSPTLCSRHPPPFRRQLLPPRRRRADGYASRHGRSRSCCAGGPDSDAADAAAGRNSHADGCAPGPGLNPDADRATAGTDRKRRPASRQFSLRARLVPSLDEHRDRDRWPCGSRAPQKLDQQFELTRNARTPDDCGRFVALLRAHAVPRSAPHPGPVPGRIDRRLGIRARRSHQ